MYPLLCEQETKIFLLSINRRIQWCIGFIDLSLISVHTNVIKVCVNFHIARVFLPSVLYGKIKFCESNRFLLSGSHIAHKKPFCISNTSSHALFNWQYLLLVHHYPVRYSCCFGKFCFVEET